MPDFDDIFEHGRLAKEFNKSYKFSPEYEELICIFEKEHPKMFNYLKDIEKVVKPIVVRGMLKRHFDYLELLDEGIRDREAVSVAEIEAIKWMEEELEEVLDNKFRIFNYKTGLHYNI